MIWLWLTRGRSDRIEWQGAKLFYKKSAAEQERLKLSEVKHSRLAMLAIIGELVQMLMFHKVSCSRYMGLNECNAVVVDVLLCCPRRGPL